MRTIHKILAVLLFLAVLLLVACRPAPKEEFAIFLLAEDIAPDEAAGMDLADLPIQAQPLLTTDDIVAYSANEHEIELQASTCDRLRQVFPEIIGVRGVPFVACVGSERIYTGAFWTPLSSLSYNGVVIQQPCMLQEKTIRIELGYPSASFFTGRDPRSDPRLIGALRAAGKLR